MSIPPFETISQCIIHNKIDNTLIREIKNIILNSIYLSFLMKRSSQQLLIFLFFFLATTALAHEKLDRHYSEHKNDESHPDYNKFSNVWARKISSVSDDKFTRVIIAVVIVSLPSIPVFFVLVGLSKIFGQKKRGSQVAELVINEKILRYMLCLAVGSLVGDVLFCINEKLVLCKK